MLWLWMFTSFQALFLILMPSKIAVVHFLDSTSLYRGTTLLDYITLQWLYYNVLGSTILLGLYLALLHSTAFYHAWFLLHST